MTNYAEEASYLEERVLRPLQRAVSLVRELHEVESLLRQKQDQLSQMDTKIQAATNKQHELTAALDRMRDSLNTQRAETQAQLQEDRKQREQERMGFVQIREQLKEANQLERERLTAIQAERQQAERELDSIRQDTAKRLESLQAIAR